MTLIRYSDYFTTLHDDACPVGSLGRGTHYSILRHASWHNVNGKHIEKPQTHDFAIIWDEDHDTRIVYAIEKIYRAGLLAPIQFIGERKAFLSIVVAAKFFLSMSKEEHASYIKKLQAIAADIDGDYWNLEEIGFFDKSGPHHQTKLHGMIACEEAAKDVYLRNIDNLWNLGTKPFIEKASEQPVFPPPLPK